MITIKVKTPEWRLDEETILVWVEREDLQPDDLIWGTCSGITGELCLFDGEDFEIGYWEPQPPYTKGSTMIYSSDHWLLVEEFA